MFSKIAAITALVGLAKATVDGFDISGYQESVDFAGAYKSGARFVMIKATESTDHTDSQFSAHYTGAADAGLIRGGYHFAVPSASSGSDQAAYFVKHGGGWSDDGITLPGMLDMEFNPYGDDDCYGLSGSEMADWIAEFVDEYKDATGTYPLIYTTTSWWQECTGDSGAFGDKTPLVLARYAEEAGELPAGWGYYTFWQFDDGYAYGGDSQVFNGDEERLKALAKGS